MSHPIGGSIPQSVHILPAPTTFTPQPQASWHPFSHPGSLFGFTPWVAIDEERSRVVLVGNEGDSAYELYYGSVSKRRRRKLRRMYVKTLTKLLPYVTDLDAGGGRRERALRRVGL